MTSFTLLRSNQGNVEFPSDVEFELEPELELGREELPLDDELEEDEELLGRDELPLDDEFGEVLRGGS